MSNETEGHLFRYDSVKPLQVDADFTEELLRLGFDAWKDALGHTRPDDQLRQMFPYDSSEGIQAKKKQFSKFARHGSLVIALDLCDTAIAGYAMGRNDVSGSLLERTYKRVAEKEKVYAWITQVAVDPMYQGNGIGRKLVRRTLEGFKPNQHPVAYVFDENQVMMRAMSRFGFMKNPYDQPGTDKYEYFGEDALPVKQFRFQAESVAGVIDSIDSSLQQNT